MYLFDLCDYTGAGFIGPNNKNYSMYGDWTDPTQTYRETTNAWIKALNEWYLASIAYQPSGTCTEAYVLYENIRYITTGDTRINTFWGLAQNTNMVGVTEAIYADYVAALTEQQCMVKQLFNILDGDTFEDFTP